jgi:hypothetical protein
MALSRKQLKDLVATVLTENTDALVEEEVAELAGAVADRIVAVDTDAYDDGEDAPLGMDEDFGEASEDE